MYEQFFGLRERPFDLAPDPRFLVMTEAHAEVLSTLEYAISSRKGVTVVIGEAGLGKTTLLRAAIDKQPERVHCIHIHNPVLSRGEFVQLLARRFGLSRDAAASKTILLDELENLLHQARRMSETTVLMIDEAQSLPAELLEEVRLLANIETNSDRLLSVILAGQPELAERLNDPQLRQFKQRIALRCQLRPLTREEGTTYLAGRITAAGGYGANVLTREAVTEIYERSGGVPRTMSVIADNALLGGYAARERPVKAAMVRDVCRDLDLPQPPASRQAWPMSAAAGNGHLGNGARHEDPEARFRMLRARVSLPSESVSGKEPARRSRPADAETGSSQLFSGVTRKRRFFFFWTI